MNDLYNQIKARRDAARSQQVFDNDAPGFKQSDPGWIGGFVGSTISSFGELFGNDPSDVAATFRAENPIAGFASEMVGMGVPYAGMAKLAQGTVKGIALTERAMASIPGVRSLSALDTPIRYGAAKLAVQFSPLELSRLGIGFVNPDTDGEYGNLLADVGLSSLMTGGFGAAGGFFRRLGTREPKLGRVIGADQGFQPTFEYRMSRTTDPVTGEPVSKVSGDLPLEDVQHNLLKQVYTQVAEELPNRQKSRYVDDLENGTPEQHALIERLNKPTGDKAGKHLQRETFMDKNGMWRHSPEERARISTSAGFEDMEHMAETLVNPRLITVNSDGAAGVMAKVLDDAEGLQYYGENAVMGREKNNGLWFVMKRIRAGAADATEEGGESASKSFGTMKIATGDQWVIGKTDRPQVLIPEAHKVAQLTVNQWAKYRSAWKPTRSGDPFNDYMNVVAETVTARDFMDLKKVGKQTALAKWNERLTNKLAEVTGLKGSEMGRKMAEGIYAVVKPTVYLENQSSLYQRLWTMRRATEDVALTTRNKIMGGEIKQVGHPLSKRNSQYGEGFMGHRPVQEIWTDLTVDERNLVARAATTQTPAADLAKLSADGLISPKAARAVEELQAINKDVWEHVLQPALKAGQVPAQFDLLEGYIMPRIFKGDWFIPIENENGVLQWLASGSPLGAKKEAEIIVEEAAKKGLTWKLGKGRETHLAETTVDEVGQISELVSQQMARNGDTKEVLESAMRRLELARMGGKKGGSLPNPQTPGRMAKERTGVAGSPDIHEYTLEDVIKATEDHYDRLLKFAAHHTWRERWLPEAMNLQALDKTLYQDLLRKSNQLMGIEGKGTQVMNQALNTVFGGAMGGKAATRIAQGTNELMFQWNIGIANPVQAILNLLNPLQTVAPWVAFMSSNVDSLAKERLMQLSLRMDETGKVVGWSGVTSPMKVLSQAMKEIGSPDEELMAAYGRAKTDSTLSPQLYEGFVGGQSRARQTLTEAYKAKGGGVAGSWEFIKRTSNLMFEKSEEFSRAMAFTSGWIVGRDMFGLADEALYRFAKRATHVTMYGYSVVDRSRMFTGPIGSMFGLFKNWQMHFIGSMVNYAGLAIRENIWAPMLWQGGAALAVGGLGALPLKTAADGLANWHDGSPSSYLWLQKHWGEDAGDAAYFGLPGLLNASLQASASLPGTDVVNDMTHMMNFVAWERAKQVGRAVGHAWTVSGDTDENALRNSNVRDQLMGAFLPRAIFRAMAVTEGDYIKSMQTGYPQVRGVPAIDKMLYGMGLNPIEVEQAQVASRERYKDEERNKRLVASLGEGFADAWKAKDREEMTRLSQRAALLGVDHSKMIASATTRMRRETTGDILSRYGAAGNAPYRAVFED